MPQYSHSRLSTFEQYNLNYIDAVEAGIGEELSRRIVSVLELKWEKIGNF